MKEEEEAVDDVGRRREKKRAQERRRGMRRRKEKKGVGVGEGGGLDCCEHSWSQLLPAAMCSDTQAATATICVF